MVGQVQHPSVVQKVAGQLRRQSIQGYDSGFQRPGMYQRRAYGNYSNAALHLALGWLITNGAGLASYPIDTVRRRMMMTSGEAVKYKSSLDAFKQILKNEGAKSLFKGAGFNIVRAFTGGSVLAGYDELQRIVFGKKYESGDENLFESEEFVSAKFSLK
ncbi:PREDICTED: ADP,ATP carrier protein 1, mitochondrial-like [Prunus mume]|uniref:ADP/ATP translocase n=1 Tax=Prunus mume TaxID=102107 RepID=A0ABM0NXK1_PRUMU|nr:PREDICTED: ADP,ATP carrier protein 1, mitochondrial-like [Prunus mume]